MTYWNAVDLVEDDYPLYCGRAGNMGDRPGNWAIQNADLILAVGTRISIRQVGYNWQTWARAAEVIMVDIDPAELKKPTLHGDGSIMMNLQELQTIITNNLPIKIFLINNNGYHSIRITQTNLFNKNFVGIGEESGDLSFPELQKIAEAFGYRYFSAHSNAEMKSVVDEVLKLDGPVFTEIFTDTVQVWEPKSSTKRLADGTLVSPPLEDLAPFLPREEMEKQMFIPLMDKQPDLRG